MIGKGHKHPNPLSVYMDTRGPCDLRGYISRYWSISGIDSGFDAGLRDLETGIELLQETVPEIKDFACIDSVMYPVFYYSVLMHHVLTVSQQIVGTGSNDAELEMFLEGLAGFLCVPDTLHRRVLETTRKFYRLSECIQSQDPLDRVMELLAELPDDTLVLIQFYYLLRAQKKDVKGLQEPHDVDTEALLEHLFTMHEQEHGYTIIRESTGGP